MCGNQTQGKKFLHLIRYEQDSRDEENEGHDQWEGKIRAMKNKISKLDTSITNTTKALTESITQCEKQTLREMALIQTEIGEMKKD